MKTIVVVALGPSVTDDVGDCVQPAGKLGLTEKTDEPHSWKSAFMMVNETFLAWPALAKIVWAEAVTRGV